MRTGVSALGLDPGASRADIARAYRRLALLTHPDVSPDPTAPQRFAALTEAYERALAETETHRAVTPRATRPPSRRTDSRQFVAGPVHVVPEPIQTRREA